MVDLGIGILGEILLHHAFPVVLRLHDILGKVVLVVIPSHVLFGVGFGVETRSKTDLE